MKQGSSWKQRIKDYWKNLYQSNKNKISRGASNIFKIISWPRGDNWRRPKHK